MDNLYGIQWKYEYLYFVVLAMAGMLRYQDIMNYLVMNFFDWYLDENE